MIGSQLIEELSGRLLELESIDVTSVHEMIEAKEINTGVTYPYSISSLLIQTREWIISNDFISKEQKSVARNSIKTLISEAEQTTSFDRGNDEEQAIIERLEQQTKFKQARFHVQDYIVQNAYTSLNDLFKNKCAYCESSTQGAGIIDHFLKG